MLRINTFGRFQFKENGKILLEDKGRSRKVWHMLSFLVANRGRQMSPDLLSEIFCGDERITNPAGTIKNLIYRLRVMLDESRLPKNDYILYKNGVYYWNPDIECEVDSELFEEKIKEAAGTEVTDEQKLGLYLEAIDLYKGKYLPGAGFEVWALSRITYFHNAYTDIISEVYTLLSQKNDYARLIPICENAIKIDRLDESVWRAYIKVLIALDRHQDALKAYNVITELLYKEFGFNPSKEFRELYREIKKTIESVENDILVIMEDLNECGEAKVTYFCDYEIFKDIYRFMARGVARTGQSIFIMLCTITDYRDQIPQRDQLNSAMEVLQSVIGEVLRRGDLYSRYSVTQYIIMLPGTSYENGLKVGRRLENAYQKRRCSKYAKLHYKLQPLDPKIM